MSTSECGSKNSKIGKIKCLNHIIEFDYIDCAFIP